MQKLCLILNPSRVKRRVESKKVECDVVLFVSISLWFL